MKKEGSKTSIPISKNNEFYIRDKLFIHCFSLGAG